MAVFAAPSSIRGYGRAAYFRGVWCGDLSLETLPGHQLRGDCVAVLSASLKNRHILKFPSCGETYSD